MRIAAIVRTAVVGWFAGILAVLLLSFVWPQIFPGFVNYQDYDPTGPAPNLALFVLIALAVASLPAIIGGVVGGRVSKEGGQRQQVLVAAIFGVILALPCGCFVLYQFSGY